MGFQFKNIETNHIYTLNEIDEIAAKFWCKEVHPRKYSYPGHETPIHAPNWFDMLGHPIENLQFFTYKDEGNRLIYERSNNPREAEFDMVEIASLMLNDNTRYSESVDSMYKMLMYIKPYVELCYHLKSLNIVGIGRGWW
jgi:hypothetical protein